MKIGHLLLAFTVGLAAQAASAVDIDVVNITVSGGTTNGTDTANVQQGDTVTIDVRALNNAASPDNEIFGMGSSAYGYNSDISFVSGEGAPKFFTLGDFGPPFGAQFGGFSNFAAGPLVENQSRVTILNGASTDAQTGTGLDDYGVNGGPGPPPANTGNGEYHARLIFQAAVASGSTQVEIGTDGIVDAVILAGGVQQLANNAIVTINVPEPASTLAGIVALGSVFGVAGLRRRR